jgi:hypothetical protein
MHESFLSLDPYVIVIIITKVSLISIYYIALLAFSDGCGLNCLLVFVSVQKSS